MIDLKSMILGGLIVLAGVWWAIRQQQQESQMGRMKVIFFKKEKQGKRPAFSEN